MPSVESREVLDGGNVNAFTLFSASGLWIQAGTRVYKP